MYSLKNLISHPLSFFFFSVVLKFQFRASFFLGRHSSTWTIPSAKIFYFWIHFGKFFKENCQFQLIVHIRCHKFAHNIPYYFLNVFLRPKWSQALMAHTCNLATQEAEIRRIKVRSQPWANSSGDPILKIPNTKKGWQSSPSGRVPAQ
jgi:ABC-type arginine/histidine transport system permease subunit